MTLDSLENKSYEEVAVQIIHPFVEEDIMIDLREIINKSYINFSDAKTAPVTSIEKNKYILELFYGPTLLLKTMPCNF